MRYSGLATLSPKTSPACSRNQQSLCTAESFTPGGVSSTLDTALWLWSKQEAPERCNCSMQAMEWLACGPDTQLQ